MRIFTTILALIGAAIMLASGVIKLVNSGFRSDMNSLYEIGGSSFGTWFYLLVGLFEILIAVLLFIAFLWRNHTSDNPHVLTHLPSDIVDVA